MKTNKSFALGLALGLVVSGVSAQNKLFSELVGPGSVGAADERRVAGAVHHLGWRHGDLLC